MTISRLCSLTLLLGCIAAMITAVSTATAAPARQWQFDVSLDGKPIGYHKFEVQRDGSEERLVTEASFDVKFLFITAFRYRHINTEVWRDGCLARIDAATDSNGKKLEVRGAVAEDGFSLARTDGLVSLPGCVQSFAYWNPAVLGSQRLLNSQTGVYEDVSLTFEDREQIEVAGEPVDALRYRLSAQGGDIRLWYSSIDNTWVGLEAPAKGGRTIRYQAVAVPSPDNPARRIARSK